MGERIGQGEPQTDPSFANRFLGQAEGMNDKYGIADKLGLIDPVHREVLTMYLGLRMLRAEVGSYRGNGFTRRGLLDPMVAQVHKFRRISADPYQAALNSYEDTYRGFIEEAFPDSESRTGVFPIQNAVTDLISRFSVQVHMHGMRGSISFEMWKPDKQIVRDWGMDWAGKIPTQREAGL